jgi:hypothetical protein
MGKIYKINRLASFRWIGVTVLFIMVSWLHMGPSLTHCGTVVLSKPGDHTAGLIYNSWVHPKSPKLGVTNLTNYPFGEDLWQPTSLSSFIPSTGHLVLSRLTNVVCGWNLMVLFGYMSSALIMFGFMRWLTRNDAAAFFSAYAVTFTPYHAFSSWGQLAGLLGAVFILALWQFVALWRKPSWMKAVSLGTIFGVGFYTDGYFILIGLIMLFAIWVASVSYGLFVLRNLARIRKQLKCLALTSLTALVMLLPLGWVNLHYAPQIGSYLSTIRGDVVQDAQTYSAQLYMYFMPTKFFPVAGNYAQGFQNRHFNNSGDPGLIFIGFSVIFLASYGCWHFWYDYKKNRQESTSTDSNLFVVWTTAFIVVFGIWFSLRPRDSIFGIPIYNPSAIVTALTPSWRVFGRLYSLVAMGFAVLAGLGLTKLTTKHHTRRYWIIAASLLFLVLELRSFPYSSLVTTFNYQQAPPVYSWLKNNSQISAVAEYPLDSPPQGAYLGDYYTFQTISGKPIINTLRPDSPETALRRSIYGINDPQTLPVLRALGINLVNIRPTNPKDMSTDMRPAALNNNELMRIFSYESSEHPVDSFTIKPGKRASYALEIPTIQYYQISPTHAGITNYLVGNNTLLSIIKLPGAAERSSVTASFNVTADSERQVSLIQNGRVVWNGVLNPQKRVVSFEASTSHNITIYVQETSQPIQLTISRLQIND